ncbi:MAG: PAS domain-containing protein [Rhodospirillales bacterium]
MSWEHRVKGKDGVYRTILSLGRPVRDENGRITSWVGFNLDISERKQAEEALAQHAGLLTAITDSAADAIFVSDDHGRVTLINRAAEKIFGWSRRELTGQVLHEAIHSRHPDGQPYPASECPLRRVYLTGETLLRHEDVFFRKDGSQVQVACSNAPLMIDGRIAGSVLVAHDITERKRSEQALRESEARLRRTVEYALRSWCMPITAKWFMSAKRG